MKDFIVNVVIESTVKVGDSGEFADAYISAIPVENISVLLRFAIMKQLLHIRSQKEYEIGEHAIIVTIVPFFPELHKFETSRSLLLMSIPDMFDDKISEAIEISTLTHLEMEYGIKISKTDSSLN